MFILSTLLHLRVTHIVNCISYDIVPLGIEGISHFPKLFLSVPLQDFTGIAQELLMKVGAAYLLFCVSTPAFNQSLEPCVCDPYPD